MREANTPDIATLIRATLLHGACHRARIRATRWLAMTSGYGRFSDLVLRHGLEIAGIMALVQLA